MTVQCQLISVVFSLCEEKLDGVVIKTLEVRKESKDSWFLNSPENNKIIVQFQYRLQGAQCQANGKRRSFARYAVACFTVAISPSLSPLEVFCRSRWWNTSQLLAWWESHDGEGFEKWDFSPRIKKMRNHEARSTHMELCLWFLRFVLVLLNLTSWEASLNWNLSLQEIVSKKLHN